MPVSLLFPFHPRSLPVCVCWCVCVFALRCDYALACPLKRSIVFGRSERINFLILSQPNVFFSIFSPSVHVDNRFFLSRSLFYWWARVISRIKKKIWFFASTLQPIFICLLKFDDTPNKDLAHIIPLKLCTVFPSHSFRMLVMGKKFHCRLCNMHRNEERRGTYTNIHRERLVFLFLAWLFLSFDR